MKKWKKINIDVKGQFKSASSRNGAMSVGMVAIVICIVIVVNLIVGQLSESIRNVDLTSNNLYEITDTSREILTDLDQTIEMKVLATKDSADDRIKTFLSKYTSLSNKIDVEWIDPVQHPSALETYDAESDTIVITCPDTDKTTTVNFSDILVVDEYSYYMTGSSDATSFDGEGQLTSAINYVINDTSKNIYQTTGHGEGTLSTSVTDLLDKMNLQINDLNLLMATEIPEDCDLLLMYAPTNDITEDEATMINEYLDGGGKVYLMLGTSEESLPNLEGIMETYGLAMEDGYIADMDRCYQGNYYYIFPQLSVSDELADGISSEMVLLINARGMTQTNEQDESITVTPFMTTSDNAYAVTETDQKEGSYVLGATATRTVYVEEDAGSDEDAAETDDSGEDADQDARDDSSADAEQEISASDDSTDITEDEEATVEASPETAGEEEDEGTTEDIADTDSTATDSEEDTEEKEARLTVVTTPTMIDDQITGSFTTLENLTLFTNTISANFDDVQNVAIEAKSLEVTYNTMQHAGLISLAVIFGIPLVVLIGGFIVWWRRRKA